MKNLLFIPMYNCKEQIIRVLNQLNDEVCHYLSEILIIDNRSKDGGELIVKNYIIENKFNIPVSLIQNDENYGFGGSVKVAFDYAINNNYEYCIILHGDDQGDIENLLPYLKNEEYKKYDCFLGARFMKGSRLEGYSKIRTLGNYIFNLIFSIAINRKIYDLGSGLNVYKVSFLKNRFYIKYCDDMIFNYCMIIGFAYYDSNIKFFPIVWREDDQVSNVKLASQAFHVLSFLLHYLMNKKFISQEHRVNIIDTYTAKTIYSNRIGELA